ncbi:unnamed protein product, partial [marine sediment metagenome]
MDGNSLQKCKVPGKLCTAYLHSVKDFQYATEPTLSTLLTTYYRVGHSKDGNYDMENKALSLSLKKEA